MAEKRRELSTVTDPVDELARLFALNLRRDRGLQDVIVELDSVGIRQARIAELLGTSAGYVNVALARAKKPDKQQSKARKRTSATGDGS